MSEPVAWLPKRRWEQMTAAEPWLTNIVYSEDQGKFFECVPLYSAPVDLTEERDRLREANERLSKAAVAVMSSWDDRMGGEREELRVEKSTGAEYWAPRASMVESEAMAKLRAALNPVGAS